MVPLSSLRAGLPHDPSCVLSAGDHPFIRHESYVLYRRARLERADKLLRGVKEGKLIAREPVTPEVHATICAGFIRSRLTPPALLRFYEAATGPV